MPGLETLHGKPVVCIKGGTRVASRGTNFYKIPIFGLGVMPQKQNSFVMRVAQAAKNF
jgi:hypothetical protein